MGDQNTQKILLSSNQPGLIDTSTKRIISKSVKNYDSGPQMTQINQQPVVTRKITRRLIPMDEQNQEVQYQEPQMRYSPQPQPQIQSQQQMIWPVAVQFNEDDALTKMREEKILGLLERQSEMLANMLQKYKRIEEDQSSKLKKRIKELERENEEIWQKKRQNYMIYNVAQSVDQRLKEFNDFQLKPWMDQGQPILLKPLHLDDREFFDVKKKKPTKKKIPQRKQRIIDDGLMQDPDTGDLWDPNTGLVVTPGSGPTMNSSQMK